MGTIANKYYVKVGSDSYQDFTTKFVGLTILKFDDFLKEGKAKNIYTASWVNSNNEDVDIPDNVYFEQPDIDLSFEISDSGNANIDVLNVHSTFISYMRQNKVKIKSLYAKMEAEFVCLAEYKPSLVRLHRGSGNNYILGTITLHRVSANSVVAS